MNYQEFNRLDLCLGVIFKKKSYVKLTRKECHSLAFKITTLSWMAEGRTNT